MTDLTKLLDNGWVVVILKNGLGTYTASAFREGDELHVCEQSEIRLTDRFTPEEAVQALFDKLILKQVNGKPIEVCESCDGHGCDECMYSGFKPMDGENADE